MSVRNFLGARGISILLWLVRRSSAQKGSPALQKISN